MKLWLRGTGIVSFVFLLILLGVSPAMTAENGSSSSPGPGPGAIFVGLDLGLELSADERGQLRTTIHGQLDDSKVLVIDFKENEAEAETANLLRFAHEERAVAALVLHISKTEKGLMARAFVYMPATVLPRRPVTGRHKIFGFRLTTTRLATISDAEPQIQGMIDWQKAVEFAEKFVIGAAETTAEAGKKAAGWMTTTVVQPLKSKLIPIELFVLTRPGGAELFLCNTPGKIGAGDSLGATPEGKTGSWKLAFFRKPGTYALVAQKTGYTESSDRIQVIENGDSHFSFDITLGKKWEH